VPGARAPASGHAARRGADRAHATPVRGARAASTGPDDARDRAAAAHLPRDRATPPRARARQARRTGPPRGDAGARGVGRALSPSSGARARAPAGKADAERGRAADAAPDVEAAAEQAHALADPEQAESPVPRGADQRRLDVESLAVVLELH